MLTGETGVDGSREDPAEDGAEETAQILEEHEEHAVDGQNDGSDIDDEESRVEDYFESASIPVIIKILTERFLPAVAAFSARHADEVHHWNDNSSSEED